MPWLTVPAIVVVVTSCVSICHAAERMALVIGNSKYGGDAALANPANDADAVEQALTELHFTVIKKKDVNLQQMEDVLVEFRRKLPKGGLGMFYFAGHGVQVEGNNYLVPVGAKIREEFEVKRQCVDVGQVLDAMAESDSNLRVLILDCCRNNPFKRSWKRGFGDHGLKAIDNVPDGTIIAYSTAAGKAAEDGEGKNSAYAEQLVKVLRSRPAEGLELVNVFRKSGHELSRLTGQKPWLHIDTSVDDYFLRAPGGTGGTASIGTPPNATGIKSPPDSSGIKSPSEQSKIFVSSSTGMKFVLIGAGTFVMGSPKSERWRDEPMENQVSVKLSKAFYLGATEVSQAQWIAVMGTTPWKGSTDRGTVKEGDNYPVTHVSWLDAKEFCKKLSAKENAAYRLPTEAEWEYACRGGTTTTYSFGDDPGGIGDFAWSGFYENGSAAGEGYPHEVGRKKPNPFGLYDMYGNVEEWCEDVWQFNRRHPGGTDPLFSPPETAQGPWNRVARGGSYSEYSAYCRSAKIGGHIRDERMGTLGFRVVRSTGQ